MFENHPIIDFTLAEERETFQKALDSLNSEIDAGKLHAQPIIGGKTISTTDSEACIDPSEYAVTLGMVDYAGQKEAYDALLSLEKGGADWANRPARERANFLFAIADRMIADRYRLAALIIREAGKPWREADADVVEAIDFCRYYGFEMLRLGETRKTVDIMGEQNFYFYQPRGKALVISPWNFPLAIPCGMFVAALVTGNATILKPAEQTSLIAAELAKIVLEVGVPENAFAFLPGRGELIGKMLVDSPAIDMICFTGSKEVGLSIIKSAANIQNGQKNIKRVIAEMGGKNAIIIDEDADLDEAIKGVGYSAFGFAGQKCSACSRVIAVGDAYGTFIERMCEATADLIVGKASDSATYIGPVIDEFSQRRILDVIKKGEENDSLAFKGKTPNGGYYVPATIFKNVSNDSSLWKEEIFGPVLACQQVSSFEEAISQANNSEYALTGGLFSRSPANITRATREFSVGNLYINRSCTGAIVNRQPFGGFRMSGVGSKAGGPDYLLQFLEPRVVSENTMRRGFTPELS